MRRVDPSPVVPDGDGSSPLPAYPDSDVGSSPRSVGGFAGGRPGYPTEELPLPVKWDESAFARVKLMCSYGGRILPRPHDNQLRYVGGESRIAVVNRNITFSELTVKLSRMFGSSVVIKYQLPYEDLDALISVTSDEDLENMMEEYDRLQSVGIPNAGNRMAASARLRVFLFPSKLERCQTASLSEMMENNNSRERWFVDILNGLPVPVHSRVRSETSSIVSETPEYPFQGNIDALEEWAAAASYGNSVPSSGEQVTENKQGNPVSATTLFGSLLQQASPNEAASAPGSPSPLKPKSSTMGSSSSAPPAVISLLSSMADAASKGLPTPHTEVDGSMGSFDSKTRLGSGDSSGSIPEQRKHVDSEILLTSDKSILSSSVGGVERLLPAGLMDDDDSSQKYLAKGSFGEVSESSEAATFDAGGHQVVSESSNAVKGDLASESTGLTGQPIFDDELSPMHVLAHNLNVLQLEEGTPSPYILSPSSTSSASAQLVPPVLSPQQPMSKFGVDEMSKYQAFPVSPRAGVHLGEEDRLMQQVLPDSALNASPSPKRDIADGLSRQVSPSLAHFLPSLGATQQPLSPTAEDTFRPQVFGANTTKDVETSCKVQATTNAVPPVQQQKLPAVPVSSYLYQQSPAQGLEAPASTSTYATQAPGIQFPFTPQVGSPVAGMVTNPLPPIAVPVRPTSAAVASRPAAVSSRPQSPPVAASLHTPPLVPQVRTTSSPPVVPSMLGSNVSQPEAFKGPAPISSNVAPPTLISTMAEGVRSNPYQQGEGVNMQRQLSDPLHSQRLAGVTSQLGSQFNPANLSVPPTPGMPTRFRAVGLPLQQVVEGVPLQQAPVVGVISEKKAPTPIQRAGINPSARPPSVPGGQYTYTSAIPLSPALGGGPRYNLPSNIMLGVPANSPDTHFTGANPFVDSFQGVSTYQDMLEVPPADQQQRRPIR
ncbi:hypothetical protein L7F22_035131 [Adiantum nelumboides]|nr:hypothetical protein [Adiantum nelumboides]